MRSVCQGSPQLMCPQLNIWRLDALMAPVRLSSVRTLKGLSSSQAGKVRQCWQVRHHLFQVSGWAALTY